MALLAGLNENSGLRIVLVAPRNPLNIGAAARAMSNFGFLHLRVVNPYEVAFREARSAVRAGQLLRAAEEYQSVAEAVADCALVVGTSAVAHREPCHPVLSLDTAAPLLRAGLRRARVAILFGSEKTGLSNEDLSYCHWLLRIPTRSEHVSMNLGQAVAVCVYELARPFQTQELSQPAEVPAAAGELDRMTDAVMEVLDNSGYIKPTSTEATREKIRRLIRRLNLSGEDVGIWLGIYRQIAWKLRADRE